MATRATFGRQASKLTMRPKKWRNIVFFSSLLRLERRSEGNKSNEDPPTYFWVVNHKKRDMVISRFNGKLRHRLCEPQGREVGEILT